MDKKDLNVATHMVNHCERIERYLKRCDNSYDKFKDDELIQDGVTMQILAMGELTTHFSDDFKSQYASEIDWRNLKQLRNICAHRYGTLDYEIIWTVATSELPDIKKFFQDVVSNTFEIESSDEYDLEL